MRAARFDVTLGLIEALLPKGSKILCVRENEFEHTVTLGIEHPSFDEVPEGQFPPRKTLMCYKTPEGPRIEYAS
jgi:hypothetical protein